MTSRAQREYSIIAALFMLGVFLAVNAIIAARTQVRDDLRRDDVTNIKRGLEMYYNKFNTYPSPPEYPLVCTQSNDQNSWFFGENSPLLKSQSIDAIPHDVREKANHIYQYCPTQVQNGEVSGYYIQAWLEVEQPSQTGFDEDEMRKFHYRIVTEQGKTLYRVCGGTEQQCEKDS